jgi:predicted nuclease with TOPRIM domain
VVAVRVLGVHPAGSAAHVLLTVGALVAEGAGLLLIVWDARRVRAELGERGWFAAVREWIARAARVQAAPPIARAAAPADDDHAARLDRLDREIAALREAGERQQAAASALDQRLERLAGEQRELRRATVQLDLTGSALFIVGAVLGAAANLVN